MNHLTLYYKPTCPYCQKVLGFMDQNGISVPRKNREETQAIREEIKTVDDKVNKIALEVVDTNARVQRIEETMATKDDIHKALGAIASFVQKDEVRYRKALTHDHRLNEHDSALQDHETRIAPVFALPCFPYFPFCYFLFSHERFKGPGRRLTGCKAS